MNKLDRDTFAAVLELSDIKARLKRELRFVPEEIEDWEDQDFLAVRTKAGSAGVLCVPYDGMLRAVPFELQKRRASRAGRIEAIICDICASWQRGTNSAVITFAKTRSSVSFLVCADLKCSFHVRNKTPEATLSRAQLREDLTVEQRIARLHVRLDSLLEVATQQ